MVNQVRRDYTGLGELAIEYQEYGGAVSTGTSPKVQYAYSFAASGSTNHSRLTTLTYPSGRALTYNYASGLGDTLSRLTSISESRARSAGSSPTAARTSARKRSLISKMMSR